MNLIDFVFLVTQVAEDKDNIKKGAVGFGGYGFIFMDISDIVEIFKLEYTSGICRLGTTRELLKAWYNDKIKEYDDLLEYEYDKIQDLYYVGAIKTLLPSLNFGGDELLFEVGMLVKTPDGELFPATFYWGVGGLTIGGWKQEPLNNFIVLNEFDQTIKFTPIKFTNDDVEELAEAFQLALQKVPVSDFEGEYWGDVGGIRMGIRSGTPFMIDIPIDEDINYALTYYEGEFRRIMLNFVTSNDWKIFEKKMKTLTPTSASPVRAREILIESDRNLINRCYNELVDFAREQYSRYAFQALAIFLMEHGAKMSEDVKKLVLDNSWWKDERYKLVVRHARIQRKKFLFDFRAKVLKYKEGTCIKVPRVSEN